MSFILKKRLQNWTAAGLRLKHKEGVKGCNAEGHVSHILSSRMSSRPMGWSVKGMPKTAGSEKVIASCSQLLVQERKHRRYLGVLADIPIYSIPYPKIKKIANFKDHIYGL